MDYRISVVYVDRVELVAQPLGELAWRGLS